MSEERWLPVPIEGFEDLYEVSDLGRVRSLDHMVWSRGHKSLRLHRGRLLTPSPTTRGYLRVTLSNDERQMCVNVHRLVLGAFAGPCPPGQEGRHGSGGQHDNRLVNLCYGTPIENAGDRDRDGNTACGTRIGNAKLTEALVRECRMRCAAGESGAALANEFGVHQTTMSKALAGRTWRHVDAIASR